MDWRFNTIWFDQIPKEKLFTKNLKGNLIDKENPAFQDSEYAILWHLKQKSNSFESLEESDNLKYLELNWANIKNFTGIEKFRNLKRLELHYCVKLENDQGLNETKNSLEFLHINQSKKFKFKNELLELEKLKVLCLNNCGDIENLDFLSNFPNLIDFRFLNTNILDGNLKPILEHPTIRTTGFLDKRNYNLKFENVIANLKDKYKNNYTTTVFKGEYSTFRYEFE